ncbi:hypothetical protein SCHPADRAFT_996701 [Schizopora paradoxa]|uniref:F-box domain-containing protein n=1 Tax=Schizopora paradoxa TaxID=27342 RepID=A0A0H2SBF5_9AGAM|nr:hypothetical protein SCHPADRAFT_996701 [Schizopora paradoxa]
MMSHSQNARYSSDTRTALDEVAVYQHPSAPSRSATALSLEIQDNIFSFCPPGDLARCARVCKSWTSAPLDRLWYTQTGLVNLFRILAPLRPILSNGEFPSHIKIKRFTRDVVFSDWKRFESYATRIRHLEIPPTRTPATLLDPSALEQLVLEKPATMPVLLPSLKRLQIWGQLTLEYPWLSFFKGVLHESLRDIAISFSSKTYQAVVDFYLDLAPRSPSITTLHLWNSLTSIDQATEASVTQIIHSLRELNTIHIQSCQLTPIILSSLHQHPNIRKISIIKETIRSGRTPSGLLPASLEEGAFRRLTDLTLLCSLPELNRYLSSGTVCDCLEVLLIDVVSQPSAESFRNCLVRIVESFPGIASLVITRREDLSVVGSKREETATLSLQDLELLPRLRNLCNLEIHHTDPISMSDNELTGLLSQCPSLSTVYLNSEPIFLSISQLTINVLPLLAKRCPHLEELSLFIDGTKPVDIPEPTELMTFENLFYIDFGSSPVTEDGDVATMLGQVLPSECELNTTSAFSEDLRKALGPQVLRVVDLNHANWKKIAKVLPSLIKTRILTQKRVLKHR